VGLRRLNKEVVYVKYAGEDHWPGSWSQANVTDYWNRVIEWFDTHLQTSGSTSGTQKLNDQSPDSTHGRY
jgi:hypothetical protein